MTLNKQIICSAVLTASISFVGCASSRKDQHQESGQIVVVKKVKNSTVVVDNQPIGKLRQTKKSQSSNVIKQNAETNIDGRKQVNEWSK